MPTHQTQQMKLITYLIVLALLVFVSCSQDPKLDTIEQWGVFEIILNGPESGNPFVDVDLSGTFIIRCGK